MHLTSLYCSKNELTQLDLSRNVTLQEIECSVNKLMKLDVGQNVLLESLKCNENQLVRLNMKNTDIKHFEARKNVNLVCIEVDDPVRAKENNGVISKMTSFRTSCPK